MLSVLLTTLGMLAQTLSVAQPGYVLADDTNIPPANSAWRGAAPHVFLGGQATLFCGSHGTMVGSARPPARKGRSATIRYDAVFTGELLLQPPLVPATRTHHIEQPIRMTERYTYRSGDRANSRYATELTAVEFSGSDFPANVRVRESPARRSVGSASISRDRQGTYRIRSRYAVWLEISVDSGRTWHLASEAVTMSLAPEVRRATLAR